MNKNHEWARFIKFGLVGAWSNLVQVVLFNILLLSFVIHPALAAILADQAAIICSFISNNHFTFRDRSHKYDLATLPEFFKFWSIVMISTLFQALVVFLGTLLFGRGILVANFFLLFGLAITFLWNFRMQKKLVWKEHA